MAKYTELFSEYLEGGGELPAAVVTSKRNETIGGEFYMALTDLTGTTWKLNSNWTATAGYGLFNIDYSHISSNETETVGCTEICIGYIFEMGNRPPSSVPAENSILIMPFILSMSSGEYITITGGTDVTNTALIEWLQANATLQTPTTTRKSVDLTTLPGWSSLSTGSHNITIVAKADGYSDSEPSAAVSVTKAPAVVMPNKGDIITLDSKRYRVLKTDGTVAEVQCIYNASNSVKFDSASSGYNNTYAGKNIDTYCNNTFYSGLSAAMKSAIVDKTFTQDSWRWWESKPTVTHYTGKRNSKTYYLAPINAAYGSSITRHCYCLSLQDVIDYLEATTSMGTNNTTLTDTNIWKMFWDITTEPSGDYYMLFRSANSNSSEQAFGIYSFHGSVEPVFVASTASRVRPAFQIDLSKIAWSK